MAITMREQNILDLDEGGLTIAQIAARLGLSTAYVSRIVNVLGRNNGPDAAYERAMRHSSEMFLRAIERERAAR